MKILARAATLILLILAPNILVARDLPVTAYRSLSLAGSDTLTIHALSIDGLPAEAVAQRDRVRRQAGFSGPRGLVDASFSFSPVLTHDPNINGGLANDRLTVGPFLFRVDEDFRARSGLVLGGTLSGGSRYALAGNLRADLRLAVTGVWSPQHRIGRLQLRGAGCLTQLVGTSASLEGCLDAEHLRLALGTSTRIGANLQAARAFTSPVGFHEAALRLKVNRHHANGRSWTQRIVGARLTSALANEKAVLAEIQLGERVDGVHAMRRRAELSLSTRIRERPVQVSLAAQRNEGGLFLGEERRSTILSAGVSARVSERMTVSVTASRTRARQAFFNDRSLSTSISWRF